jgi:hypothetical protein
MFSNLNRAALRLFESEEDALEFLEDYDLNEARVKLLIRSGRILDAAETHAKDGDMLKAVEMLSASAAHDIGHARQMIKYLLTGLQRGFTLGELPKSGSATVKLLVCADRLDKSAMTKQEADEVRPSHLFDRQVLRTGTSSLQCSERSDVKTVQSSARSRKLSLERGMTLLLCSAWTISSRPLPNCKISRSPRLSHYSPCILSTFAC